MLPVRHRGWRTIRVCVPRQLHDVCAPRLAIHRTRLVSVSCRGKVPGKLLGAWVFRGTRMPVAAVFKNLEDGLTIDKVVKLFDGLKHEQVKAVLAFAAQRPGRSCPAASRGTPSLQPQNFFKQVGFHERMPVVCLDGSDKPCNMSKIHLDRTILHRNGKQPSSVQAGGMKEYGVWRVRKRA